MTSLRHLRGLAFAAIVGLMGWACTIGPAKTGEIDIASDLSTSGAEAAGGLPIQDAEEYAVTTHGSVRGYQLKFVPFDDAVAGIHSPERGVENVKAMIANPRVLGMVGPKSGDIALAEIPVANAAYLAMVTGVSGNECLNVNLVYCRPEPDTLRPTGLNNFFRISATDARTGSSVAVYAIQVLKLQRFAVWTDSTFYGKNLSNRFTNELESRGGKVVLRRDIAAANQPAAYDFTEYLRAAKAAGAEAIFAGATSATKGCVARAQSKDILDVPYLGGTGINDPQCIRDAGIMANDKLYCTAAVADVSQNPDPAVKTVLKDFKRRYPGPEVLGPKSFSGYDTAGILIDAIGRAIDTNNGNIPTRRQVINALAETRNYRGATGTYTFDSNGDVTSPTISFFQVRPVDDNLKWVFNKQFSVPGSA